MAEDLWWVDPEEQPAGVAQPRPQAKAELPPLATPEQVAAFKAGQPADNVAAMPQRPRIVQQSSAEDAAERFLNELQEQNQKLELELVALRGEFVVVGRQLDKVNAKLDALYRMFKPFLDRIVISEEG